MTQMVQYGRLEEHPAWVMILVKVNHVLLTINSATNIVIYSYKVQQSVFFKPFFTSNPLLCVRTSSSGR